MPSPPRRRRSRQRSSIVDRVEWDAFTGRFEAAEHVAIRWRVSGYLEAVGFEGGASVTAVELQPAEAALAAATAVAREARIDLACTEIRAPIGARVSDRRVDIGELATLGLVALAVVFVFRVPITLAANSAILIVECAEQAEDERGLDGFAAVIEVPQTRPRPMRMTSPALVLRVVPLPRAAGPERRAALGIAVFSGMPGVTFFGLLFNPIFHVVARRLAPAPSPASEAPAPAP